MTKFLFNRLPSIALAAIVLTLTGCEVPPPAGGLANGANSAKSPANMASPALTTVDCSGSLPDDIVDAIYDELEKSTTLTREEWQFNIAVSDTGSRRTIMLTGWSKNRDTIFNTVKRIAPNCLWNDTNFKLTRGELPEDYRYPVGCNQGFKPCGDICIPEAEDCKLVGASLPPVVPPSANTNSNVSSSPNSNSRTAPSNSNSR
jgi:hypothetical protein